MYTQSQIQAAKNRFELLEVCLASEVTDEQAIKFLDYYFAIKSEFPCNSISEAIAQGIKYGQQQITDEIAMMRQIISHKGNYDRN